MKVSIAKIRSDDLPDKVGLRIEYSEEKPMRKPPVRGVSNRRQSINALGGGAMGKNFIQRAHLEVLKSEAIEDQFLAKKMADILCSPRRLRIDQSIVIKESFVHSA